MSSEIDVDAIREKRKKKQYLIFFSILASLIIVITAVSVYFVYQSLQEDDEIIFIFQDRVGDAVSIIAYQRGFFEDEGL